MRIVDAVSACIASGSDSTWASLLPSYIGHRLHVRFAENPDGRDIENMTRLRRVGISNRARMTSVERADGSLRPEPIFLFGDL